MTGVLPFRNCEKDDEGSGGDGPGEGDRLVTRILPPGYCLRLFTLPP